MKVKILLLMLVAVCANAQAQFDLSKLKNLLGGDKSSTISNVVNSLISSDRVTVESLAGTWKSSGPAVAFKSKNFLEKAGGTAASTVIENKLAPYYKKAGLDNFTFTFDANGKFTLTVKGKKITGTVKQGTKEGTLVFNFGKFGNSKFTSVTAYVNKGTQLSILFDISKLQQLVAQIAKFANNSTVTSVSGLLNSYQGIYAGFKFNKN